MKPKNIEEITCKDKFFLKYLQDKKMTVGEAYKVLHEFYTDEQPPIQTDLSYVYWH